MENVAAMDASALQKEERHSTLKIGLWLMIASEIMMFAGLIDSYVVLRMHNPQAVEAGKGILSWKMAATNTVILITSSLTMALGVAAAHRNDRKTLASMILMTMLLACGFLVVKYFEYMAKFTHETIKAAPITKNETGEKEWVVTEVDPLIEQWDLKPGDVLLSIDGKPIESAEGLEHVKPFSKVTVKGRAPFGKDRVIPLGVVPATSVFFGSYFMLTGLHGAHVLGGIIILLVVWIAAVRGKLDNKYSPVELSGLYWHFVDLVWIFLFPIFYLI